MRTEVCTTELLKGGNRVVNFALHDFTEAFFTFSICTHKCDLIYALKKIRSYLYRCLLKLQIFEQVHVQI